MREEKFSKLKIGSQEKKPMENRQREKNNRTEGKRERKQKKKKLK